jgi:hypothetical protein
MPSVCRGLFDEMNNDSSLRAVIPAIRMNHAHMARIGERRNPRRRGAMPHPESAPQARAASPRERYRGERSCGIFVSQKGDSWMKESVTTTVSKRGPIACLAKISSN